VAKQLYRSLVCIFQRSVPVWLWHMACYMDDESAGATVAMQEDSTLDAGQQLTEQVCQAARTALLTS
jgi:hypothetical protein